MKTMIPMLAALATLTLALAATGYGEPGEPPAARRAALIREAAKGAAAVPALSKALQDGNLVVRRTAVRLLSGIKGEAARQVLGGALGNDDALVRRTALYSLSDPLDDASLPYLRQGLHDGDALLRLAAVNLLVSMEPRSPEVEELLGEAAKDEVQAVREVAAAAIWPFHKETVALRDRKDWDHEITVAQSIPLPENGWRFRADATADGHLQKWYDPEFDDSAWEPIRIGAPWEEQGHAYDGVAWYRCRFELPARPEQIGAELAFEGVDEVAWVWVNGEYVGQHDLGTEGWDKPFVLDVSEALKWGEMNQITVRVYDSAYAGGIWKPVILRVLQ